MCHYKVNYCLCICCLFITLLLPSACTKMQEPETERESVPVSTSDSCESVKLFEMEASAEKVLDDDQTERLNVLIRVKYNGEQDLHNVRYQFRLNPEIEPYIGSGVISYKSGDPAFYVTTEEKCQEYLDKGIQELDGEIIVSGFDHSTKMSLTTDDLLKEMGLAADNVMDVLKYVTIQVTWDGGEQEETLSLGE